MKFGTKKQWYLYTDGKGVVVTTDISELDTLKGVIIKIDANDAAHILALMVEQKH